MAEKHNLNVRLLCCDERFKIKQLVSLLKIKPDCDRVRQNFATQTIA